MAQEKGVRVTCNRCGASVFLKYEGTRPREWQTPEDVYEKAPPGWFAYRILDEKRDLCPTCSEKWEEMAKAFLERKETAPAAQPDGLQMTDEGKDLYNRTIARLKRMGAYSHHIQILRLAEEIERYRDRIEELMGRKEE